jgi:hypothetical protein
MKKSQIALYAAIGLGALLYILALSAVTVLLGIFFS